MTSLLIVKRLLYGSLFVSCIVAIVAICEKFGITKTLAIFCIMGLIIISIYILGYIVEAFFGD